MQRKNIELSLHRNLYHKKKRWAVNLGTYVSIIYLSLVDVLLSKNNNLRVKTSFWEFPAKETVTKKWQFEQKNIGQVERWKKESYYFNRIFCFWNQTTMFQSSTIQWNMNETITMECGCHASMRDGINHRAKCKKYLKSYSNDAVGGYLTITKFQIS